MAAKVLFIPMLEHQLTRSLKTVLLNAMPLEHWDLDLLLALAIKPGEQ